MPNPQSIFDAAYHASLSPEILALVNTPDYETRVTLASQLASRGDIIDVPIMVYGWDPYLIMQYRQSLGYTWVPSALQPAPSIAPGVSQPGTVPYDPAHPPARSIKVSTNIADYPPFTPPKPPPPPPTDIVGPLAFGTMYLTVTGDHSPDGFPFEDARGKFIKHVDNTPFGPESFWEKVA